MFYVQSLVDAEWRAEQFRDSQATDYATAIAVAQELFWYHCVDSMVVDIDGNVYAMWNVESLDIEDIDSLVDCLA